MKHGLLALVMILFSSAALAKSAGFKHELVYFKVFDKTFYVTNLKTNQVVEVIPVKDYPFHYSHTLYPSQDGQTVSIEQLSGNGDFLIDLTTGQLRQRSEGRQIFIAADGREFYFKEAKNGKYDLIREKDGKKQLVYSTPSNMLKTRVVGTERIA